MRLARTRWTLAVSVLLALASTARAEGPGLKLGEQLVLHLGVGAELRYDSNVFFASPGREVGSLLFRGLASVDLATRPPQRGASVPHGLDFRLHLGVDYTEFLTGGDVVTRHRSVSAQAGMLATLLPGHVFTLDLYDNYVRTTQPAYNALPYNLDRDNNEAGLRLRFRPGGGRLEFDLNYTFGIDFFEPAQLQPLNVYYHRINLHGQWAFFPKTAVYIDLTETPYVYVNPTGANGAAFYGHSNSFPIRAIAGLNGLITIKLSFNAWIGYGNGLYTAYTNPVTGMQQTPPNPNTAIGGLDIRWKPTLLSTGLIGYKHDFQNSLLGEYYDVDSVYAGWVQLLWRFTVSAKVQYQNIRYAGILNAGIAGPMGVVPPGTLVSRNDNNVMLDLRVEYPFRDWLSASVGYALQYNNSDSQINQGAAIGLLPLNYLKHEPWVRLSVLY